MWMGFEYKLWNLWITPCYGQRMEHIMKTVIEFDQISATELRQLADQST